MRGDAGMIGHLGVSIDVTEQRRVAAEARAALERTALALAAGRMGTWDWDVAADRVVWDEQECRLFCLRPGDPPPTGDAFFATVHPEDRGALVEACERAARTGEGYEVEYRIGLPDGSVRWLAERCAVMRDEQERLARVVGITYDVTERRIQEERIRVLAMHDPLTGLPNRRTLREVLARELAQAARGRSGPALLLVDLDEFKRVNDTLGHAAGDELLVEVARRLLGCVRAGDVVARLGGDEFAIVAADAGGTAGLTTMAERLVASLEAPVALRGVEVRAGASVGIAPNAAGVADPDELLARADLALYAAKEAGRSTWRFFRPTMRERARDDAALERDLRRAVERRELVLHYQPIVDAVSLEARSAEALIRWRHPERGLVPPGGFLPTAERNRMIVPLTYWVLDEALSQAAAWRAEGPGPLPVAVNVAIPALEADGLVRHVERRLAAHSLPPEALVVEVTEGAMADGRQAMATLAALRRLGVRVGIDDFGAGYSSLARLRDLPLDVLKIDRAFLAARGPKGEAILRAVVELGRSLGLPTVAEGVGDRRAARPPASGRGGPGAGLSDRPPDAGRRARGLDAELGGRPPARPLPRPPAPRRARRVARRIPESRALTARPSCRAQWRGGHPVRITGLKATPVNIPLEAPMWWTGGLYPGTSKVIVEILTDQGLVGLGEAPSADLLGPIRAMGERLVGQDPLDIAACEERCVPPWQIVQNTDDPSAVKAFGAIEIGLWDLRGKAWDQPLYRLLGGKVREAIPFTEYFAFRAGRETSPEAVVDYCLAMREAHGSTCFEGKLILGDPLLENPNRAPPA